MRGLAAVSRHCKPARTRLAVRGPSVCGHAAVTRPPAGSPRASWAMRLYAPDWYRAGRPEGLENGPRTYAYPGAFPPAGDVWDRPGAKICDAHLLPLSRTRGCGRRTDERSTRRGARTNECLAHTLSVSSLISVPSDPSHGRSTTRVARHHDCLAHTSYLPSAMNKKTH